MHYNSADRLFHLKLVRPRNDSGQPSVPLLQRLVVAVQLLYVSLTLLVVVLQGSRVEHAHLLLDLLVLFERFLSLVLEFGLFLLELDELLPLLVDVSLALSVLLLDELELLAGVRDHLNVVDDLAEELLKLLVSLLDLLVQRLVLDLQLLEVDDVEAVSQLLLLLEDFLLVSKTVAQSDVLQAVLVDLLVVCRLRLLPLVEGLLLDLLAGSREDGILRDASLQLFELLLDLVALGLLLVQLRLKLRRHLVVAVLRLLEVDTNLVNVGERVEVLVLVHLSLLLPVLDVKGLVHGEDLPLQVVVFAAKRLALPHFLLDCHDQIAFHLLLRR